MADKQTPNEQPNDIESSASETDSEGHLMMPNIAAARAMSSGRINDGQRSTRLRTREKDERPGEKRTR